MTSAIEEKELQERLREAAALGDIEEVRRLVDFGASVNSQNEVNGWTHCSPAGSIQPETQQPSGPYTGAVPTFQPFFFTGAIPFSNMQELVLKVRIQNRTLKENDFIEIELDRQELTYKELLRVSCCELGVNPEHVEKIRKLPNTVLRKDKDISRLQDFQELELVLMMSDNDFMFKNAAPALTERPCYNKKASKLTY
ncbi:ankyrin repeat domain-containing protein 40 isoform X3 [Pantherophis guttatus]|uniref:Ankyrin repeat domain-containing protein 40 isoform X3 n=1 Tax=Pantherophis guttatus TaxID=94885 RepID=A0ABM3Z8L0_PANGU|nr:ankyrin repeat domain-containing protein 40 isoform X3 [Pantherophis guttatus]